MTAPSNLLHRSWLPHRLVHCVLRAPRFRRRGKPRHRQPRSPSPRQVPAPTNLSSVATPARGVFRRRGSQRRCPVRRPVSHRCFPAHLSPPPLARRHPSRSRPWIVVLGRNSARTEHSHAPCSVKELSRRPPKLGGHGPWYSILRQNSTRTRPCCMQRQRTRLVSGELLEMQGNVQATREGEGGR
jgi:hypothetical protein